MATVEQDSVQSAPYVAFATLKNFIGSLKGHAIPSRIDKSVMPTIAGGAQGQLITALRFLGLINVKNEPTDDLVQLVKSSGSDDWSSVLQGVIKSSYSELIHDINLVTATPQQLTEAFRSTKAGNLDGSTVDKAIRFFLSAIQDAKIDHAKRLVQRKPRAANRKAKPKTEPVVAAAEQQGAASTTNTTNESAAMMTFPIFFRDRKGTGSVTVPRDITADDIKMIESVFNVIKSYVT